MIRAGCLLIVALVAGCNEHGRGGMLFDGGGGSGRSCGGFTGAQCGPDEFCDFRSNTCGVADESGTCRPRPDACDDEFAPVCGCDGQVHANQCDANASGVDVDASGSCPSTPSSFTCGSQICDRASEYCERGVSDIGGEPDSFACKPLPAACSPTPSCACLTEEPCGSFCDPLPSGGLRLTCPGG